MDNGGLACPVLDVCAPDDGYIDVEVLAVGATNVDDSAEELAPPAGADIRVEGLKGARGDAANFERRSKEGRRGARGVLSYLATQPVAIQRYVG